MGRNGSSWRTIGAAWGGRNLRGGVSPRTLGDGLEDASEAVEDLSFGRELVVEYRSKRGSPGLGGKILSMIDFCILC